MQCQRYYFPVVDANGRALTAERCRDTATHGIGKVGSAYYGAYPLSVAPDSEQLCQGCAEERAASLTRQAMARR